MEQTVFYSKINTTHLKSITILIFILILKYIIAQIVPLFGDEAYYVYWGTHFFGGYYDHPPMVGWWEYIALYFSNALVVVRLPTVLSIILIAIAMYFFIAYYVNRKTGLFITALWFFSPLNFVNIFASPDIPLLFFSFFSSIVFFIAIENFKKNQIKKANILFFCTGLLWGCAFLSKYFAIFILLSYLLYFFSNRKVNFSWFGIIFCLLGATPFVLQHLYWNYTHCWSTLYFHMHRYENYNLKPMANCLKIIIFFVAHTTPLLALDAFRKEEIKYNDTLKNYSFYLWAIPALCFLITAIVGKSQGLHWYFFIFPYFFIWLGLRLSTATIKRRLIQVSITTGVIYLIVLAVFLFPPKILINYLINRYEMNAQLSIYEKSFIEKISPYLRDVDLVIFNSYSAASTFNFALKHYKNGIDHQLVVGVLNSMKYGRVFDMTVNYNLFDKKNVLFVVKKPQDLTPYFKHITVSKISIDKKNLLYFYLIKGRDFNAKQYIFDKVIPQIQAFYSPNCQTLIGCNKR